MAYFNTKYIQYSGYGKMATMNVETAGAWSNSKVLPSLCYFKTNKQKSLLHSTNMKKCPFDIPNVL